VRVEADFTGVTFDITVDHGFARADVGIGIVKAKRNCRIRKSISKFGRSLLQIGRHGKAVAEE